MRHKNSLDNSNVRNHINDDVKLVLERLTADSALYTFRRIFNAEKSNRNSDKNSISNIRLFRWSNSGLFLIKMSKIDYSPNFLLFFGVHCLCANVRCQGCLKCLNCTLLLFSLFLVTHKIRFGNTYTYMWILPTGTEHTFAHTEFVPLFIYFVLWIIIVIVIVSFPLEVKSYGSFYFVSFSSDYYYCFSNRTRFQAVFIYSIIIILFMASFPDVHQTNVHCTKNNIRFNSSK